MRNDAQGSGSPERSEGSSMERQPRRFRRFGAECYCGLGPACPAYRDMSEEEREFCSANMRAIAQAYYMNGL